MRTGQQTDEGEVVVEEAPADDSAMQARLILGTDAALARQAPAPPLHPSPPLQPGDVVIAQPAAQPGQPPSDFVPLDERWHREHAPAPAQQPPQRQPQPQAQPAAPPSEPAPAPAPARAVAPAAPARPAPVVKTVAPPTRPTVVVTPTEDEGYYEDEGEEEETEEGVPEVKVHTPMSKFLSTIVNVVLFVVAWNVWTTGARYSIAAVNGSASVFKLFKIDVLAWNHQPFFVFEGIATLFGWIPLIGGAFTPLATLPKIWVFPLIITIGESVFWPRRRKITKDLLWFWKPLKREASWKHYTFLTFLAFDVISTCVGAIMDQTIPGGIAQLSKSTVPQFNWGVILEATRTQLFMGIGLGVFCAVVSERMGGFTVRDTIGLWFPPNHWIHKLFRPSAYVQYK